MIKQSKVKKFLLEDAKARRAQKFTRVSQETLNNIDAHTRSWINHQLPAFVTRSKLASGIGRGLLNRQEVLKFVIDKLARESATLESHQLKAFVDDIAISVLDRCQNHVSSVPSKGKTL